MHHCPHMTNLRLQRVLLKTTGNRKWGQKERKKQKPEWFFCLCSDVLIWGWRLGEVWRVWLSGSRRQTSCMQRFDQLTVLNHSILVGSEIHFSGNQVCGGGGRVREWPQCDVTLAAKFPQLKHGVSMTGMVGWVYLWCSKPIGCPEYVNLPQHPEKKSARPQDA